MSGLFVRGRFLSELDTRQLNRSVRRLHAPLVYRDPVHGEIVVPAGFDTDFASIKAVRTVAVYAFYVAALLQLVGAATWLTNMPWALLQAGAALAALVSILALVLYATVAGYCNLAGTVHDWLYQKGALSRSQADKVLARAGRAEGVSKWRVALFWLGVRIGGRRYFKQH